MATTYSQTLPANYNATVSGSSIITRFMNWCGKQQENRMLWIGIALAGHGCIATPLTGFFVMLAGTNIFLFTLSIIAMMIALVTNLAALPTKITIPALFVSFLLDLGIIIACAFMGFNAAPIL